MRKVKDAVDLTTNEKIYFKGHAKATYLSDGRNVEDALGEIPSAESSVFEAIYNTTTYDEIVEAYLANKHCICRNGNMLLSLVELNYQGRDKASFSALVGDTQYTVYCFSNNTWGSTFYKVEKTTNKVTSLSSSSTDTQYPSAKAVYDALQNVSGGSDVFEAIYGETTYEEIVEANNEGKVIICHYSDRTHIFQFLTTDAAYFVAAYGNYHYQVACSKSDSWRNERKDMSSSLKDLANGNIEIIIQGNPREVATPQYVENLLGTIINGDY